MTIAVLFARKNSIYKTFEGCDVYDIDRDALTWPGGAPVVAHPPCRAWGTLRHMAKPVAGEKELAIWAIEQVRRWGGVLEHPKRSLLWPHMNLPTGQRRDAFGGFSMLVNQSWWGHRAEKATLLYICGVEPRDIPDFHIPMKRVDFTISNSGRLKDGTRRRGTSSATCLNEVTKREREATPEPFARWLVELAGRCQK
jgi:hypothetical protein